METAKRSWVKAVLWNLIGFASMCIVGLIMTGCVAVGGAMALINTALGFACYVAYERVWARIAWGRGENSHG